MTVRVLHSPAAKRNPQVVELLLLRRDGEDNESRSSCPEAIWQAATWWHAFYQRTADHKAIKGAFCAQHDLGARPALLRVTADSHGAGASDEEASGEETAEASHCYGTAALGRDPRTTSRSNLLNGRRWRYGPIGCPVRPPTRPRH